MSPAPSESQHEWVDAFTRLVDHPDDADHAAHVLGRLRHLGKWAAETRPSPMHVRMAIGLAAMALAQADLDEDCLLAAVRRLGLDQAGAVLIRSYQ